MNNGKTRASLLAIAAVYLLHLAYELFQDRGNTETTMSPAARILFIVLFAAAAAGLLIYAYRIWQNSKKEQPPPQQKDEDSMK